MKNKELKQSEEKTTIYFGTMFLLTLLLDFVNDGGTSIHPWAGGVLVILIIICLILGIIQISNNQELKKEMANCKNE